MPAWRFPAFLLSLLVLPGVALGQTRAVTSQPIAAPVETVPAAPADDASRGTEPIVPTESVPVGPLINDALPEILYGDAGLPEAVRRMRQMIIEATRTGDLEALRPVIEANGEPPALSGGGDGDDPITTLKLLSGDERGREILAILQEVVEAGYVHIDVGTPHEMYVWPYFTRIPLDRLSGPQMVELFRLIAAGDFLDMQEKGVYSFYRVGISPDGVWRFFEDGD